MREPDQVRQVLRGDPDYPGALSSLGDPPRRLWTIGNLRLVATAPAGVVAIVGTREASSYGLRVATAMGRAFAEAGAVVVSGLARGIDSAAHEGALAAAGGTVAVLGTGVDRPYPVGNWALHGRIAEHGLVVSENEPGRPAYRGCFPRRNRIIAALAQVTIVIEAGFKSGALNTATHAAELGRTVGGVPGPIDMPKSSGVNHLIRDGAHLIASVDDALSLLGVSRNSTVHRPQMGADEAEVWAALGQGESGVDGLCDRSGLPARRVLDAVGRLELAGLVQRLLGGEIARAVVASDVG